MYNLISEMGMIMGYYYIGEKNIEIIARPVNLLLNYLANHPGDIEVVMHETLTIAGAVSLNSITQTAIS